MDITQDFYVKDKLHSPTQIELKKMTMFCEVKGKRAGSRQNLFRPKEVMFFFLLFIEVNWMLALISKKQVPSDCRSFPCIQALFAAGPEYKYFWRQ